MATRLFYVLVCFLVHVVTQLPFEVESRRLVDPKRQYNFNFLDNLENVSKGRTAKGIPELRRYLKRFGYLNNEHNPDDNNEEYDGVLESAVKLYQTFFKLNVTGKLDSDTIRVMEKVRCGVADNPVQVLSKKKLEAIHGKQQHKYLINIDADYAFFPGSPKWVFYELTYRIESSAEPVGGFTVDEFEDALALAAIEWSDNSMFTIEEAPGGGEPAIRTGFHRGDHGDGFVFTDPVLAHAFSPSDGRMHFNADKHWSINDALTNDQFDMVWTAIHELGHVLGLDHSLDPNAIMFPTVDPGKTKRHLGDDDIQGITTLYPWPH